MYKFLISALVGSLLITACGGGEDTPATGTGGSAYAVASVGFDLETQNTAAVDGDIDDPAIWAHATDRSKSLIIASAKDGGLRVYDLAGKQVQSIASIFWCTILPARAASTMWMWFTASSLRMAPVSIWLLLPTVGKI